MMSDIVERLRWRAENTSRPEATTPQLCAEAAAEIESLRQKTQYWPDNAERDAVIRHQKEEIERLRADLRLAVMSDSDECKALSQEVERLVKSRNRWGQKYNALLDKHKRLRAALEEAKTALAPLATCFLYPDDIGADYAADLRSDDEWDEAANEAALDDVWIARGEIRRARAALEKD